MKNNLKRWTSFLLVLAMVLGMFPGMTTHAHAAESNVPEETAVNYRWELNGDKTELVSVSGDGYTANNPTRVMGNAGSNGTFSNVSYELDAPITLQPDKEWVIEWHGKVNNESLLLYHVGTGNASDAYLYLTTTACQFGYNAGGWTNMGVSGVTMNTAQTYRIVNQVNADGSNMPQLYINGVHKGAMDKAGANKWLNGQTLTFTHLGSSNTGMSHGLSMTLDYVKISTDAHAHDYEWVVKGDELSGTCTVCGKKETKDNVNYRWELNAGRTELVSVENQSNFTTNALERVRGDAAVNGKFTEASYDFAADVTLQPDDEWVIQWRAHHPGETLLMYHVGEGDRSPAYLYTPKGGCHLGYNAGSWTHSGYSGISNEMHNYRIVNRVYADGTNMPHLYVDDVLMGPMNNNSNWLNGQTLTFTNLGSTNENPSYNHGLNATVEYMEIYTQGKANHTTHTYGDWAKVEDKMQRSCIVCGETETKNTLKFRWEQNEDKNALVSVATGDYTENKLDVLKGNIEEGITSDYVAIMEDTVTLYPDDEWSIEWKSSTNGENINMLLSGNATQKENGMSYIYWANQKYQLGYCSATGSYRNGSVSGTQPTMTEKHVYRLENRVNGNSNEIHMLVDGEELGVMTVGTPNELSGKQMIFKSIGADIGNDSFELDGVNLEYLEIVVKEHKHSFSVWAEVEGKMQRTCASCGETETKGCLIYRWEQNAAKNALVSVTSNGYSENVLTKVQGTIEEGVTTNYVATMQDTVALYPDDAWYIEWKASTASGETGYLLLSGSTAQKENGMTYIYWPGNYQLGYCNDSGSYRNHKPVTAQPNMTQMHVYRLENHVKADGTNEIHLLADGADLGVVLLNGKADGANELIGKTMIFNSIGASFDVFPLDNVNLEYMEIAVHDHSFGEWAKADGKLQRTCTGCGKAETKELLNYRWELNAAKDALVSIATGGNTKNELTRIQGTIVDGIHQRADGETENRTAGTIHTMEDTVMLVPTSEWIVEWRIDGNEDGYMLLSDNTTVTEGMTYLFRDSGGYSLGVRSNNSFVNYTVTGDENYIKDLHTFCLRNVVAENGTNAIYMYVDGNPVGQVKDTVSGKTFNFSVIGGPNSDIFPLTNVYLEHIQIWTDGENHTHDYIFEDSRTNSTCKTAGSVVMKCACGEVEVGDLPLDYTNHEGETEIRNAVAESCGEDGYTGDTYCLGCDTKIEEGEAIPATGAHNYTIEVEGTRVDSTCKTAGSVTMKCECGATKVETLGLDPDNHEGETEIRGAEEASCGAAGYTGDTYCLGCDTKIEEGEEIPATGEHNYATEVSRTDSTCKTAGSVTMKCECGATEVQTLALDPDNHEGETEIRGAEEASCGAAGYTGDTYCLGCNTKIADGEEIPATGEHNYATEVSRTDSTCKTAGSVTMKCACGATKVQDLPLDYTNHESAGFAYINNGETHTKKHACCDAVVETIAHTYEDGMCDCEAVETFTVTWIADGKTVDTEVVEWGKDATKTPTVPAKDGHSGAWDKVATVVKTDVTINAIYTANLYTVTWSNGDGGSYDKEYEFGATITIPVGSIFEDTFRKTGYTVSGWTGYTEGMTMPAEDLTFTAVYEANKYKLTIIDLDGQEVMIDVAYGANLVELEALNIYEFDKKYVNETGNGYYEFQGWLYDAGEINDWIDDNSTMPAEDFAIWAEGIYTGWQLWIEDDGEDVWVYLNQNSDQYGLTRVIRFEHNSFDPNETYADDFGWTDLGETGRWSGKYIHETVGGYEDGLWIETKTENENGEIEYIMTKAAEDYMLGSGQYLHYLVDGVDQGGLRFVGEDLYFFASNGRAATGNYYAWATECILPCGNYEFDKVTAKALQGMVEKADGIYLYTNGKLNNKTPGITKIGDDYCFVASNGRLATGKYYCWASNVPELKVGNYEFDENGKMLQGLVQKDDGWYYYLNGKLNSNPGITKIGDDYYFVASNGRLATGKYYCWASNVPELKVGNYEFDENGKMLQGLVQKDDGWYYYLNGKLNNKTPGITKIGDDYYFVASNGRLATGKYYCWASNVPELPVGNYEFDENGKMLQGLVQKDDGWYYYLNGKLNNKTPGITKIGDDYYFVASNGRLATGKYFCWASNVPELPVGSYTFAADGKMIMN